MFGSIIVAINYLSKKDIESVATHKITADDATNMQYETICGIVYGLSFRIVESI